MTENNASTMPVTESLKNTPKTLLAFLVLITLLTLSAFVPAKWMGVKPKTHTPLNLQDLIDSSRLSLNEKRPELNDLMGGVPDYASTTDSAKNSSIYSDIEKKLNDPDNLTSSFSKNLYVASVYLNKNNITDEQSQKQVVENIVNEEGAKIVYKSYSLNDLKIINNETSASLRKYGNDMGPILTKSLKSYIALGDGDIMKAYITNGDASVLSSLTIKKDRASEIISQMLAVNVPLSASTYHLMAINELSQYLTLVDGMSHADTDPVKALVSYKQYLPLMDSLRNLLSNFVNYFKSSNIIFSQKEAGHIFSSGYTTN